jgi:hypothetical protein
MADPQRVLWILEWSYKLMEEQRVPRGDEAQQLRAVFKFFL